MMADDIELLDLVVCVPVRLFSHSFATEYKLRASDMRQHAGHDPIEAQPL
jgi:hypothetical protein